MTEEMESFQRIPSSARVTTSTSFVDDSLRNSVVSVKFFSSLVKDFNETNFESKMAQEQSKSIISVVGLLLSLAKLIVSSLLGEKETMDEA